MVEVRLHLDPVREAPLLRARRGAAARGRKKNATISMENAEAASEGNTEVNYPTRFWFESRAALQAWLAASAQSAGMGAEVVPVAKYDQTKDAQTKDGEMADADAAPGGRVIMTPGLKKASIRKSRVEKISINAADINDTGKTNINDTGKAGSEH